MSITDWYITRAALLVLVYVSAHLCSHPPQPGLFAGQNPCMGLSRQTSTPRCWASSIAFHCGLVWHTRFGIKDPVSGSSRQIVRSLVGVWAAIDDPCTLSAPRGAPISVAIIKNTLTLRPSLLQKAPKRFRPLTSRFAMRTILASAKESNFGPLRQTS